MLLLDAPMQNCDGVRAMELSDRIGRRIKLHDLQILTTVVQAGSMSKAAALLNTTQSTISRSISELEQTIGVRLLDRNAQGVEPTHYGRALLKRGIAAFDEIKQGIEDIRYLSDPGTGEVRIGSAPAMAEGIVLAIIEKLSQQYPRVVFHVIPGGTLVMCEQLRARRIELGFVTGAVPEEDMDQHVLYDEPLVVVAGIGNPWARRRKIKLAELVNEPWTWPPAGTLFDARVVEAFRAIGLEPPRARVYYEGFNMRTKLAADGRFLAVVPAYIFKFATQHPSIKVLPIELPTTYRPSAIVTLKNRTLSPLAQRVIDCAREITKPLAKPRSPNGCDSKTV
jgi:DNA-binding transcriptional LysR family regulator